MQNLAVNKDLLTLAIVGLVAGTLVTIWLWEKVENRRMPAGWQKKTSPKNLFGVLLQLEQSYPKGEFHPFTRVLEWAEIKTTHLPQRQSIKILQRFIDSMRELVRKGKVEEIDGPAYRVRNKTNHR